jgi:DNA-binding NarL/FixJ family response regulator
MNVLIVDGHPLVHEVLGAVVRSVFGEVKLRTAKNLEGVIAVTCSDPKLDLALLDLAFPGCAGVEALKRFRALVPGVPVVVMSANDSPAMILAAFRAGAIGYLPKTLTSKLMTAAMNLVAAGGFYVPYEALGNDPSASAETAGNGGNGATAVDRLGLTDRQFQVLRLIHKGYNNRKIARQLQISEGTVKQHVHALFGTLGVSSRTEAIATAHRRGLHAE